MQKVQHRRMHRPAVAAALTALVSVGAAYTCQNLTIPISVSARQGVFSLSAPANNIEVTNFILDLTQQGHNLTQEVLTGVCDLVLVTFRS